MTEPAPPHSFPRVPAHAWAWLQRSRPVVAEVADRLIGRPAGPGFVDDLRVQVEQDPFVRDVVVGVVAEIAFGGRVPTRRPPGASWDRGLTWWAAAIAGMTPADFEARSTAQPARQRGLFDGAEGAAPTGDAPNFDAVDGDAPNGDAAGGGTRAPGTARPLRAMDPTRSVTRRAPSAERVLLVRALRDLLAQSEGGQVPASAVRQLLAQLEQR